MPLLYISLLILGVNALEPPRCCVPTQWQADFIDFGERVNLKSHHATVDNGLDTIVYDFMHRRLGIQYNITHLDGSRRLETVVFKEHKIYHITNDGTNCTLTNLHWDMTEQCILGNETYLGSSYMGYGNDKMVYDTWHFRMGDFFSAKYSLTRDSCLPVMTLLAGTLKGVESSEVFAYVNLNRGIRTPSVFDIPDVCHESIILPLDRLPIVGRAIKAKNQIFFK